MAPIKGEGQISFIGKTLEDEGVEKQVYECLMTMREASAAHKRYGSAERQYKKLLGLDSLEEPTEYLVHGPDGHFVLHFDPQPTDGTPARPPSTRVNSSRQFVEKG